MCEIRLISELNQRSEPPHPMDVKNRNIVRRRTLPFRNCSRTGSAILPGNVRIYDFVQPYLSLRSNDIRLNDFPGILQLQR